MDVRYQAGLIIADLANEQRLIITRTKISLWNRDRTLVYQAVMTHTEEDPLQMALDHLRSKNLI